MTRQRRLLIAPLLTAALIAALAVSAAEAAPQFTAGQYPVDLRGWTERGDQTLVTEAGTIECKTSYRGEAGEASTTMTLVPTFGNCFAFEEEGWGPFISVYNTGCAYVLHAGKETAKDEYSGTVDLKCEAGKAIYLKIVFSSCELEIKEQSGLGTVTYVNDTTASPKKEVTIDFALNELAYVITKDGVACPYKGTGPRTAELISDAGLAITGHDPLYPASRIGVDIGEGGEEEASGELPQIFSTLYPATLTAAPAKQFFAGESGYFDDFECETSLDGSIVQTSPEAILTPEFENCQIYETSLEALTNGCVYRLSTGEQISADAYSAAIDIECEPGKAIVFRRSGEAECNLAIPAQDGLEGIALVDNTAASPRSVSLEMGIGHISYNVSGGAMQCPFSWLGFHIDGELTSEELVLTGALGESPAGIEVK